MYCSELIESQGSYSLKAFLDRIEDVSGVGHKSHQSLMKDTRIKEIQTLVNKLAIRSSQASLYREYTEKQIS